MADKSLERTVTLEVPSTASVEHLIETLFAHAPKQGEHIESISYSFDRNKGVATFTAKLVRVPIA